MHTRAVLTGKFEQTLISDWRFKCEVLIWLKLDRGVSVEGLMYSYLTSDNDQYVLSTGNQSIFVYPLGIFLGDRSVPVSKYRSLCDHGHIAFIVNF